MQTNHSFFICGGVFCDHAQTPFSAYPFTPCFCGAFAVHAAADSFLWGFMFCALSGQRIPQRNCTIVAADLPQKSQKNI